MQRDVDVARGVLQGSFAPGCFTMSHPLVLATTAHEFYNWLYYTSKS